ncbi:acetyl-CoA carboxylase biotin carboxyl carrier protein subunit [Flavobacteriaceae bacterium M23B6Z8]
MAKKIQFQVKVNDTYNFSVHNDSTDSLDIIKTPDQKLHLVADNRSFLIEVKERNFDTRSYKIRINSTEYTVGIETALDELINKLGLTKGLQKKVSNVNAPMPGQIISVNVQPGQEVKENEPLLILEAMKMENVMVSPRDGIIKEIHIAIKDVVEKGQLLVAFE